MARVAIAGFQHETNTFSNRPATLADFEAADAWPALVTGDEMLSALAGANLPAAGFIDAARAHGHRAGPLLWCSATPSGPVTTEAFDTLTGRILRMLEESRPRPDAVYLDLHGAMVSEDYADADGEILRRVRQAVGSDVPVVASLDFHANVSDAMLSQVQAMVAYRTYPHIDMAETGERAAALLDQILRGQRLHCARARSGFLIPLTAQYTGEAPMADIVGDLVALEGDAVTSVSMTAGFPLADVAECGTCVFAWDVDRERAQESVDRVCRAVDDAEPSFRMPIFDVDDAVRRARGLASSSSRPVVLADTQDNPGAGGNADTVHILKALLEQRCENAVVALLHDPTAAARAHEAGVGATIELALGAGTAFEGELPLRARFRVDALGDGRFDATGPFYAGARMQLGPMALFAIDGVRIVVSSRRQQAADRAMLRHVGVEPEGVGILVLKSSVHFRADFGPIASAVMVVRAPGPNVATLADLPYRRLRQGVRIGPGGSEFMPGCE